MLSCLGGEEWEDHGLSMLPLPAPHSHVRQSLAAHRDGDFATHGLRAVLTTCRQRRASLDILPHNYARWDDASMSEKKAEASREHGHHNQGYVGSPTTQQLRTVGQRRRDAEVKLDHHLEEARHRDDLRGGDAAN